MPAKLIKTIEKFQVVSLAVSHATFQRYSDVGRSGVRVAFNDGFPNGEYPVDIPRLSIDRQKAT
jgi:hypothetical protein